MRTYIHTYKISGLILFDFQSRSAKRREVGHTFLRQEASVLRVYFDGYLYCGVEDTLDTQTLLIR